MMYLQQIAYYVFAVDYGLRHIFIIETVLSVIIGCLVVIADSVRSVDIEYCVITVDI